MNDFDQRWQKLAKQADGLFDGALPELPFGFAARVLARSREATAQTWEDIFSVLGLRAVMVSLCLCAISAGLAYTEAYPSRIEHPTIEQPLDGVLLWP